MNRVHVDSKATVGRLLAHLGEEQGLLSKHVHAPLAVVSTQLSPADAAAIHAGRRQLLNWNPVMADSAAKKGTTRMELLQIEGFTDVMLEWHCGTVGSNAVLIAQWDGAQFGKLTVGKWADMFMMASKGVVAMLTGIESSVMWTYSLPAIYDRDSSISYHSDYSRTCNDDEKGITR